MFWGVKTVLERSWISELSNWRARTSGAAQLLPEVRCSREQRYTSSFWQWSGCYPHRALAKLARKKVLECVAMLVVGRHGMWSFRSRCR